ncbi:MAG: ATP-binding cassette domain-containing protein [Burkholderiaceae bacterium]|nr:ATP-binding cassette domain-containing protein [Burkholderiaceae bacterium]
MIRLQKFSLMRGTKLLFDQADLTINPGEKVGLIGTNGSGKSTLFAMLRDELQSDSGSIDYPKQWRVAHVAQETPALERAAVESVIDGDTTLRALERELATLEAQGMDADGNRIGELHALLADADAYTARSRAEQLLIGLGFSEGQFENPVASFSGGWRMRLNLAQALMCPSDLLLLDEPTNHLDLDAIIWLESWLKNYAGTMIVISHDRDFLDGVTNVIAHIDERKLKRYSGNYSAFERQRAAQLELAQSLQEKQQRKRAHLQSFIDRFKAKATKAKQAQSRIKALARMEELAPLRAAAEFSFEFREPERAPNPLLVLDQVDTGYRNQSNEEKIIVGNITFTLQAGQRIGLLGVNGAGKSTLIKTIAGDLSPLQGDKHLGKGLVVGYFAQQQLEMLQHDDSPLMHLMRIAPNAREQELRDFLGRFNFPGDMVKSPIAPFSGGEKARLALALIVWQKPNLLLLDEPTNHLDLETREALTEALAQFDGTLILVSHDRHLLRATTDEFLIVADGQLTSFDGDLDDYRDWLFKTRAEASTSDKKPSTNTTPVTAPRIMTTADQSANRKDQKQLDAKERQRLSNQRKPLEKRLQKLESEINGIQQKKASIELLLANSDIYEAAKKDELKQLLQEQQHCTATLEQLESEWLQIQDSLEQITLDE